MLIDTKKKENLTIIYLNGDIDIYNHEKIEKKLHEIIAEDNSNILLNLENIDYINSSGLRIFISLMRQLMKENRKLRLCQANSNVINLLKVIQLVDIFEIYSDENKAIDSFAENKKSDKKAAFFEQTA